MAAAVVTVVNYMPGSCSTVGDASTAADPRLQLRTCTSASLTVDEMQGLLQPPWPCSSSEICFSNHSGEQKAYL